MHLADPNATSPAESRELSSDSRPVPWCFGFELHPAGYPRPPPCHRDLRRLKWAHHGAHSFKGPRTSRRRRQPQISIRHAAARYWARAPARMSIAMRGVVECSRSQARSQGFEEHGEWVAEERGKQGARRLLLTHLAIARGESRGRLAPPMCARLTTPMQVCHGGAPPHCHWMLKGRPFGCWNRGGPARDIDPDLLPNTTTSQDRQIRTG